MKTAEAFQALIKDKAACQAAGITPRAMYSYRENFKKNKVSLEFMEEVLAKAGYKIKQQTEWITPQQWEVIVQSIPE